MSGEVPLPAYFSFYPYMVEGTRDLSDILFYKALISFMGLYPHDLRTS